MTELITPLCADLLLLFVLVRYIGPILSLVHPLTHYLIYHLYVVTIPAMQLLLGADPMYAGMEGFWAIEPAEYVRAIIYADIALVAFAAGVVMIHANSAHYTNQSVAELHQFEISNSVMLIVLSICFPIGIAMFIAERGFIASSQSVFNSDGYTRTIAMWPVACVIACIYKYGFRRYFVFPLAVYLIYVGTQGYLRFMALLPIMFVSMIFLAQRGRRWPSIWGIGIACSLALVFPQLKYIGEAIQTDDTEVAVSNLKQAFFLETPTQYRAKEELFDPYAGALTMTDDFGQFNYGKTYLSILTLPFPRSLWPEKPGLGDHIIRMATLERPYDKEGRAIGFIAEAYINFGVLGVIFIPLFLGYFLTKWYATSVANGSETPEFLLYLCVAASLLQVFRDGLTSLIVFSVINNTPILAIFLLHRLGSKRLIYQTLMHRTDKNLMDFNHDSSRVARGNSLAESSVFAHR